MKLEVERCGGGATLRNAIRLNRVKRRRVVTGRGVEGEGVRGGEVSVWYC